MFIEETADAAVRQKRLAVIGRIFDSRDTYTPREWGIVQLYYKCGLSHREIARIFHVPHSSISRSMRNIRRKALSK